MLPQFYSGATGQTGRFSEGFLLRRLQVSLRQIAPLHPIPRFWASQSAQDERKRRGLQIPAAAMFHHSTRSMPDLLSQPTPGKKKEPRQ